MKFTENSSNLNSNNKANNEKSSGNIKFSNNKIKKIDSLFKEKISENNFHLKDIGNDSKLSPKKDYLFTKDKINELLVKFYHSINKIYADKANKLSISKLCENLHPEKASAYDNNKVLYDMYIRNIALKRIDLIAKLQSTNLKFVAGSQNNDK